MKLKLSASLVFVLFAEHLKQIVYIVHIHMEAMGEMDMADAIHVVEKIMITGININKLNKLFFVKNVVYQITINFLPKIKYDVKINVINK